MQIKDLRKPYYLTKRINDKSSPVAIERLKKIERYERFRREGVREELALEAIETPRSTLRRWQKRYRDYGVAGLENGSRRPHKVRQRQWSRQVWQQMRHLRRAYPTWGKEKIHKILTRDRGVDISLSTVGRLRFCSP